MNRGEGLRLCRKERAWGGLLWFFIGCRQVGSCLFFFFPLMRFASCSVMCRRRQWHPTPVLLPGKFHGYRSLEGCSPWGRWGLDTTEWLHFHFSLSSIGEGNGNPLQCSCLENTRDGGAWWAAVYGFTQSWTRLKWLSSSSSSVMCGRAPPRTLHGPILFF